MIYTIRSDIRRAVFSKGFLVGVLGLLLVIALSAVKDTVTILSNGGSIPDGYHLQIILTALYSDSVTLAIPILCSFSFTTAFVDDIKSGFIKQYLPRSGKKQYVFSKLIACFLSGGLTLSIGMLLSYAVSMIVFLPMEPAIKIGNISEALLIIFFQKVGMFFFSGALWSLIGFTLASAALNRYLAYASSFIIYYLLIIIYERYFDTLYFIYPKEWLNPFHPWFFGCLGLILFLSALILVVSFIFIIIARRRLNHG
jgi:hypothetical protein